MKRYPLLLSPAAKDYLWGGNRLNDDFNLNQPVFPFAEAWVCSTHPDGASSISSMGCSLRDFLKEHPDYLGTHPIATTQGQLELPILIKLIDAKKDLSIQVHPDDEYALNTEGQLGKTEMWYVLDAKPETKLVYGFNQTDITPGKIRAALANGTFQELLNYVPIHKNDVFFIEAGTVHAIGAGALIAEIQENSNITYRLYDYDRTDKNGNRRPLHLEQALTVAKLQGNASPRQPMRVIRYRNGCASELLTRCKYFQVERLLLNTEINRQLVSYKTNENSFHALLCVNGCGSISSEGYALNFFKGDCFFIPANSEQMKLHGKAQLLDVSC